MKEIPESLQWANNLKVGDEVFVKSRYGLSKTTVTKLTATTIVVGENGLRFRRDTLSRRVDLWWPDSLVEATPSNLEKYLRQQRASKIISLSRDFGTKIQLGIISSLSNEDVEKLLGVLETAMKSVNEIIGDKK